MAHLYYPATIYLNSNGTFNHITTKIVKNNKYTYQRYGLLSHVSLLVRDRDKVPETRRKRMLKATNSKILPCNTLSSNTYGF